MTVGLYESASIQRFSVPRNLQEPQLRLPQLLRTVRSDWSLGTSRKGELRTEAVPTDTLGAVPKHANPRRCRVATASGKPDIPHAKCRNNQSSLSLLILEWFI